MKNDCPCGNCQNKGCGEFHSECEEYQKWRKQEDEKKELIRASKQYKGRGYIKPSTFNSRVKKRSGA